MLTSGTAPANNLAAAGLIGQLRPADTAAATLVSAPAAARGVRLSVVRIVACNVSGAAATIRIFHDDDGTTYDQTTALYYDAPLGPGQSMEILAYSPSGGLGVAPGGSIGCRSSVGSAVTFTAYGTTGNSR